MKRILSFVRRAVDDYHMIDAGDRIAVGVSGGKDSVLLLNALCALARFYDKPFSIHAVTLDLGYTQTDYTPIKIMCEALGVPYTVVETGIKTVVFDVRGEKNPCSLCAKLRSGALNRAAKALHCNKVALGHHNEDAIETFFLSLFYEGRIHCFSPVTYLDRMGITLIRPLIYTPERQIKATVGRLGLPVCKNPCPVDGMTKRQEMKEFVNAQFAKDRQFKKKVFTALKHAPLDGWQAGGQTKGGAPACGDVPADQI